MQRACVQRVCAPACNTGPRLAQDVGGRPWGLANLGVQFAGSNLLGPTLGPTLGADLGSNLLESPGPTLAPICWRTLRGRPAGPSKVLANSGDRNEPKQNPNGILWANHRHQSDFFVSRKPDHISVLLLTDINYPTPIRFFHQA